MVVRTFRRGLGGLKIDGSGHFAGICKAHLLAIVNFLLYSKSIESLACFDGVY